MGNTSAITSRSRLLPEIGAGAALLLALSLTSLYSYLLFHSLAELFSIAVAWTVFFIAWNTRRFLNNSYLLFISIALLYIGALDLVHTLAFQGMGVFAGSDANLPTQLWIAARYLQSITFLIAPFLLGRKLNPWTAVLAYGLAAGVLLLSIFYWKVFPDCYLQGVGLTPFKKVSEWVISLFLLGGLVGLWHRRGDLNPDILRLLALSLTFSVVSELFFTAYITVSDLDNLIGHLSKILAFYFLYRAIIQTGLVKPYNLIFKELKESQEQLEVRVEERTAELVQANAQLQSQLEARRLAEAALNVRNRQQAAVAELGRLALRCGDPAEVMRSAVRSVADVLDVRFCRLLEWAPEQERFLWREGYGWEDEAARKDDGSIPVDSEPAFALASSEPTVCRDLHLEKRFSASPLLLSQGVRSGISVVIPGNGRPFGLLSAFDTRPRDFTGDDAHFFQALANVLADAVERKRVDDEIRELNADLERRVQERTSELEAANRELEAFSYSVAHDLRGPLAGVDGFVALLEERYGAALDEKGRHYIERIREGVERMKTLTEDLLTLARSTRAELRCEPLDLAAIASEIAADLDQPDRSRRVEWVISNDLRAVGDRGLVQVLFQNLLANAWKFTAACPRARIEVGRLLSDEGPVFFVRDNGAGFDMAEAHRLFKPFSRLHDPREFPGTGIGLATVSKIVARHGGRIWAEGKVNQGAAFYFTLPAAH